MSRNRFNASKTTASNTARRRCSASSDTPSDLATVTIGDVFRQGLVSLRQVGDDLLAPSLPPPTSGSSATSLCMQIVILNLRLP